MATCLMMSLYICAQRHTNVSIQQKYVSLSSKNSYRKRGGIKAVNFPAIVLTPFARELFQRPYTKPQIRKKFPTKKNSKQELQLLKIGKQKLRLVVFLFCFFLLSTYSFLSCYPAPIVYYYVTTQFFVLFFSLRLRQLQVTCVGSGGGVGTFNRIMNSRDEYDDGNLLRRRWRIRGKKKNRRGKGSTRIDCRS